MDLFVCVVFNSLQLAVLHELLCFVLKCVPSDCPSSTVCHYWVSKLLTTGLSSPSSSSSSSSSFSFLSLGCQLVGKSSVHTLPSSRLKSQKCWFFKMKKSAILFGWRAPQLYHVSTCLLTLPLLSLSLSLSLSPLMQKKIKIQWKVCPILGILFFI